MNTEKQLQIVNFEQAYKLNELGFDWECEEIICDNPQYLQDGQILDGDEFYCPTVALALKWIRDEKDIICHVITEMKHFSLYYGFLYRINYAQIKSEKRFTDHESAESALLDELLDKLLKELENDNRRIKE